MDMDTKRKEIIKEFNEKYGRELLNIEKCKAIREEYLQKKNDLLQKVSAECLLLDCRQITFLAHFG